MGTVGVLFAFHVVLLVPNACSVLALAIGIGNERVDIELLITLRSFVMRYVPSLVAMKL